MLGIIRGIDRLQHGANGPFFHHQLCVDAYGAQHSGGSVRPITAVFALVGLYLAVERGFTGRQVQIAHMKLVKKAGKRTDWPRLEPPEPTWKNNGFGRDEREGGGRKKRNAQKMGEGGVE